MRATDGEERLLSLVKGFELCDASKMLINKATNDNLNRPPQHDGRRGSDLRCRLHDGDLSAMDTEATAWSSYKWPTMQTAWVIACY